MNPSWLAQLAPDRAPAAVGWWPPAVGWWALALLVVVLTAAVAASVRWWSEPRRRLRRAALRELKLIRASAVTGSAAARAVENLLRRYAIALYGRGRAARLTGDSWLNFASAAGAPRLSGEAGRSLLAAAFGAPSDVDPEPWLLAAAEFIRAAPSRAKRLAP